MRRDRNFSPAPDWPPMNSHYARTAPRRAALPRRPAPAPSGGTGEWWPYPMFGGITLLVGCLALIVAALA